RCLANERVPLLGRREMKSWNRSAAVELAVVAAVALCAGGGCPVLLVVEALADLRHEHGRALPRVGELHRDESATLRGLIHQLLNLLCRSLRHRGCRAIRDRGAFYPLE